MSKKAKNQVATGGKNSIQMIARNKKALHDFFVEDTYEAGLVLTGTEVKSLRMGRASLSAVSYTHLDVYKRQVTGLDSPKVEATSIPHSRFDVPDLSQNSAQAAKNHGSIEIEESSSESEKLADKPGKTGSDESETKNRSTETDREETAKEAKSRFALSRSQMRRNHKKK